MNEDKEQLNAAEVGKLWTSYMGNSLFEQVLRFIHERCEDREIKQVITVADGMAKQHIKTVKNIFKAEGQPIPRGFDDSDINMNAPKLFSDEFYLYYLKYVIKAALNVYSMAIPITSRKDIRTFFSDVLKDTIKLMNKINDIIFYRNLTVRPPVIPKADMPDFINKQNYLNGYFGKTRPLHSLEITHIYDDIENNAVSKAVLIGFSQVAKLPKVKNYFLKGVDLTGKHYSAFSELLRKADLPGPTLLDNHVLASTEAPFSDKLMLFHKIDMFTMRIRAYGNALSFSARHDLALKLVKMTAEAGNYLEDGANLLIEHGWMEAPPQTINRKEFALT